MKIEIEFKTVEGLKQELRDLLGGLGKTNAAPAAATYEEAKAITAEPGDTERKVAEQVKELTKPQGVTVEEVRALCIRLKEEGKQSAAIVKKFGTSVSTVPVELLANLKAELEAL